MAPVPLVLKWQFVHSIGAGNPAFVHMFSRYAGSAPTANDLNNAAGAMSTAWNTNLASLVSTGYSLSGINVTDLSSPTAAQGTNAVAHAGTRTGGGLTANDCMLIDQKIGRRYRGGKPRQYWPMGVNGDLLSSTSWNAPFVTAVTTGLQGFINALLAITWAGGNITQVVNVSYFSGFTVKVSATTGRARNVPTPRPTPLVDPVTNHLPNARLGTQRRRMGFSR